MKKNYTFKVQILTHCMVCSGLIDRSKNKRLRSFCSILCRNKHYKGLYKPQRAELQRKRQDTKALKPSHNKLKCAICNRYYRKVGAHIVQRHKLTARQYREAYDLPVKRGILTNSEREKLAILVKQNPDVIENNLLLKGSPSRYTKDDPRAKTKGQFQKGKRYTPDEYYE